MAKTFRNASIYVATRKIAEIESGNYEHMSGDEAQIGTEGYMGHSDGADTVRLTFNTATPVVGHDLALKDFIIDKTTAQIAIIVDGNAEMWEGRLTQRSYSFDSKTGVVKGSFTFEGGRPAVA
jgi:hypothetical protein